jgi:hypothetical protein
MIFQMNQTIRLTNPSPNSVPSISIQSPDVLYLFTQARAAADFFHLELI